MTPLVPAVCGALVVAGLIGMVYALRPAPPKPPRPARTGTGFGRLGGRINQISPRTRTLIVAGAVAGLLVALVTGWVIAIVRVPAAIIGIPLLLSPPPAAASIEKLEALEEWTRSLAGKLTAGQSLRSALIKSLRSVPAPIDDEVALMVSRLWNGTGTTEDVLRAFAEDLNDSTGDVVASQLILAASGRGQAGLAKALDALAETVASDVRARRQIEADQAKPRTTARTVTAITLGVLGLLAFTGDYIEPYGSPLGQVILAVLLSRLRGHAADDAADGDRQAAPAVPGPPGAHRTTPPPASSTMTGLQLALASGTLIGLGFALLVWRLAPCDPDLVDALDRLSPDHVVSRNGSPPRRRCRPGQGAEDAEAGLAGRPDRRVGAENPARQRLGTHSAQGPRHLGDQRDPVLRTEGPLGAARPDHGAAAGIVLRPDRSAAPVRHPHLRVPGPGGAVLVHAELQRHRRCEEQPASSSTARSAPTSTWSPPASATGPAASRGCAPRPRSATPGCSNGSRASCAAPAT